MIHNLEDKSKKELVEICKIQIEEYQDLHKKMKELKKEKEHLLQVVFNASKVAFEEGAFCKKENLQKQSVAFAKELYVNALRSVTSD